MTSAYTTLSPTISAAMAIQNTLRYRNRDWPNISLLWTEITRGRSGRPLQRADRNHTDSRGDRAVRRLGRGRGDRYRVARWGEGRCWQSLTDRSIKTLLEL